jgi:hypothetical protein
MYGGLEMIGRPGLETFLYIIDPEPRPASAELITKMREYAPNLLDFIGKQKTKPRMISFLPDHERIVMEMKDEQTANKIIKAFSASPDYAVRDNRFIPGDKEIYAKNGPYKNIEVKVTVERKVRMC